MTEIESLRKLKPGILAIGSHPGIIQSMLDYDFLMGKPNPTILGIIASGRKFERFFWGRTETMVRVFSNLDELPDELIEQVNLILNVSSGRRTLTSTLAALEKFPNLEVLNLFAEEVPEKDSLALHEAALKREVMLVGPASVGLLIPGQFKLGAIGGVEAKQLVEARLCEPGEVAVFSASGGMTNEIINIVAKTGQGMSFSLSFGGDRFPASLTPLEAVKLAEGDPKTKAIAYYGELGGYDEYEIAELLKSGKLQKPLVAYIAGTVSQVFTTPPQFGHAKAMASKGEETAQAKRRALKQAGALVAESFSEFCELVAGLGTHKSGKKTKDGLDLAAKLAEIAGRRAKHFVSRISGEVDGDVEVLGKSLEQLADLSYGQLFASMLLGRRAKSRELADFSELVLKLVVDHGPYVSGAVNTMVTARAGKDLVSSLAAGLLTIGPRFGGAINEAAGNWLEAVAKKSDPYEFVEHFASQRKFIAGIGHRKYRTDQPDPRVKLVLASLPKSDTNIFGNYALAVEAVTTAKKANLILNLDGAIAAVLLDILHNKEGYNFAELRQLVEVEFFNAYFVLPRALGFSAHFLDQKRLDEGLFRFGPNDIGYLPESSELD